MPRTVITGASRGIGRALAEDLAGRGHDVLALCRRPADAADLAKRERVTVGELDVASPKALNAFAAGFEGTIDVLVNNAGVADRDLGELASDDGLRQAEAVFRVNALAPLVLTRLLGERLGSGALVVNVTSILGSNAENTTGGMAVYRASKAALNSMTRTLAVELGERGVTVVAVHPGWVQTDMGGANAAIDPATSARGIAEIITGATHKLHGAYVNWEGKSLLW